MAARLSIRPASGDDLDALRDVYRRSSLSNEGDGDLFALHPELLVWSDLPLREGRTRVAVVEGRVVGFASLSGRAAPADVEDLFVDPEWTRRGIGRALVEDTAAVARAAGSDAIEVDANPHALSFYAAVGFVAVGAADVPYGTGVRMRRPV